MLILTRKTSESIVINENVHVTVLGISNGKVRIGVKAPKEVTVHRKEIQDRINAGKANHELAEKGVLDV